MLDHLDDEQIMALQGQSREAAVQRIRALQNVQHQLTGVITQLSQIVQTMPPRDDKHKAGAE